MKSYVILALLTIAGGCAHAGEQAPSSSPSTPVADAGQPTTRKAEAEVKSPAEKLPKQVTLVEQDAGRTVTLPVGAKVSVELPVRLGRGETWMVIGKGGETLQPEAQPLVKGSGVPGADEVATYTFLVPDAGEHHIQLRYMARSEKGNRPAFNVTVNGVKAGEPVLRTE